jgi:hypothetical protein
METMINGENYCFRIHGSNKKRELSHYFGFNTVLCFLCYHMGVKLGLSY